MTALAGRRIELWVEARDGAPAVNPVMQALLTELRREDANCVVRVLEHEVFDPDRPFEGGLPNLVLLKSATSLAMSVALAAERGGVHFLNSAGATVRVHDKAVTVARLAALGLSVPETFLMDASNSGTVAVPDAEIGWVSKPTRGVHGHGVTFHGSVEAGLSLPMAPAATGGYVVDDGTRLLQQQVGGAELDLKVYVAGERCFAGRKPFSSGSYATDEIEQMQPDRSILELVRAAGEALELRCFGVDLRFEEDRPVIVDANPFPGYRGFSEAASALRSEIERSLEGGG